MAKKQGTVLIDILRFARRRMQITQDVLHLKVRQFLCNISKQTENSKQGGLLCARAFNFLALFIVELNKHFCDRF